MCLHTKENLEIYIVGYQHYFPIREKNEATFSCNFLLTSELAL